MKEKASPTKQSSIRDDPDWAYDTVDCIKHIIQELVLGPIRSESPIVIKIVSLRLLAEIGHQVSRYSHQE
jgi:hypothetical protein